MPIRRIQDGRNHSYTVNGKKVIGVTTAIGEGFPKPALVSWAARTVAQQVVDMDPADLQALREKGRDTAVAVLKGAPWRLRDQAALRGTKVHKLAERIIDGDTVPVPDELFGHVESVVKFLDDWQVRPVLLEKVVGSYAWGYGGTFDLVADLPDGRRVLFDYKTSSGIYPDVALQLAAYRWADVYVADDGIEIPMTEVRIDECKVVHVRGDGYDVIPLRSDELVFKTFCHTLAVARARQEMDAWKGDAEMPPSQEGTR